MNPCCNFGNGRYVVEINDDGLSYIDDFQDVQVYKKINADLFALSYATYVLALADASIQDNQVDPALFAFLEKTLSLMEEGLDYEVLTIFLRFRFYHDLELS